MNRFGIEVIRIGVLIKNYLGLEKGEYKLIEKITSEDPNFVGRVLFEHIKEMEGIIAVEGTKSLHDLSYIQENTQIYSVYSPRRKRLERVLKRARERDVLTEEGLIERDRREISYGARDIILRGDIKMENYWSDEVIHLLRLQQSLRTFDPNLAVRIENHLVESHDNSRLEIKLKEAVINDERARNENYWIHEMCV